jgi:hypothetical protein
MPLREKEERKVNIFMLCYFNMKINCEDVSKLFTFKLKIRLQIKIVQGSSRVENKGEMGTKGNLRPFKPNALQRERLFISFQAEIGTINFQFIRSSSAFPCRHREKSSEKLHLLYFRALGLEVVVVDVGLAWRHSQVAASHHEQGGRLDLTGVPDGRALPQHHQLVRVSRRHRVEIPTAHGGAPITNFTIKVSQVCTVLTSQVCPMCPAWSKYQSPHS